MEFNGLTPSELMAERKRLASDQNAADASATRQRNIIDKCFEAKPTTDTPETPSLNAFVLALAIILDMPAESSYMDIIKAVRKLMLDRR